MSLLRYLKPAEGLPDPRGSLPTVISLDVISEMNEEVEEATHCSAAGETSRQMADSRSVLTTAIA